MLIRSVVGDTGLAALPGAPTSASREAIRAVLLSRARAELERGASS
ncbi:hypothetical protein WME89_24730 [Sorangium sp. So ce321]